MVWINVQRSEDWLQKDDFYLINYSLLQTPVSSSLLFFFCHKHRPTKRGMKSMRDWDKWLMTKNFNEWNVYSQFGNILRGIFKTAWKCHKGINTGNEALPRVVFKRKATSTEAHKQSLYFVEWFSDSGRVPFPPLRKGCCDLLPPWWNDDIDWNTHKMPDFKEVRMKDLVFFTR